MKYNNLIKRMGLGKAADLEGLARTEHKGDTKRTKKQIAISKKRHVRIKTSRRIAAITALNYDSELWNEYRPVFKRI